MTVAPNAAPHAVDDLDLPANPAGDQARWFLQQVRTHAQGITEADVAERMSLPSPWTPDVAITRFREGDARSFTVSKVSVASPTDIAVTLDYGDDKPFQVALAVEEPPPHRIVRIGWSRAAADGVIFRTADETDSARLNDLEIRAPMTLGADTTVVYDRGEDFLAFSRLMEENVCFVAERDGELLGVACGAAHSVRIAGDEHRVMLLHHLRVPVEHRKGGVFSTLNGHVFSAYEGRTAGAYGYTAIDNAEAMRISGPGTWSVTVYRAIFDCAAVAGEPFGRVPTTADAEQIVSILNECHCSEEAFNPYTVEAFRGRLERAPDLYSWDDLLLSDHAVIGVWPASIDVTTDHGTTRSNDRRAVVLDHGFLPGVEEELESVPGASNELEQLLRAHCAQLAADGHTELMMLTSEPSPGFDVISRLAKRLDPFAFRMSVPEPPTAATSGVYVDAVYF